MTDAVKWRKGNHFEEFTVGQEFVHHWGRTINEGDNSLFSSLTLAYNPQYFNAEFAKAHGHPGSRSTRCWCSRRCSGSRSRT